MAANARQQHRQDDRYTLPMSVLAHKQHANTALWHALFHIRQSLGMQGQIIKMVSSSESSIKTIIWCCFAAGVDAVMLRSEEKANKRRRTIRS